MSNSHSIKHQDKEQWETSEVICLKCLRRWVAVFPQCVPLKNLECPEGHNGFVIKTGQTLGE